MGLKPLKNLLALTFAFAAIVPLLIVSILVINHLAVDNIEEMEKKNLLLAKAMSGQVEVFLREPLVVLQNVSSLLKSNPGYSDGDIQQLLGLHVKGSQLFPAGGDEGIEHASALSPPATHKRVNGGRSASLYVEED